MKRGVIATFVAACLLFPQVFAQQNPGTGGHVILMGELKVKQGREADFLKVIAEMTARVKREDTGNIRYEIFKAAPFGAGASATPSSPNYVFLEEWQDQAAFAAHGSWAGPMVQTQWRELTDSMQFLQLSAPAGQ
jgi:quinol monooxygenase YgiN